MFYLKENIMNSSQSTKKAGILPFFKRFKNLLTIEKMCYNKKITGITKKKMDFESCARDKACERGQDLEVSKNFEVKRY